MQPVSPVFTQKETTSRDYNVPKISLSLSMPGGNWDKLSKNRNDILNDPH